MKIMDIFSSKKKKKRDKSVEYKMPNKLKEIWERVKL